MGLNAVHALTIAHAEPEQITHSVINSMANLKLGGMGNPYRPKTAYHEKEVGYQGVAMMAVFHLPDKKEAFRVERHEFPPFKPDDKTPVAEQIAEHLMQMLAIYGHGNPPSLRIPSALELSGFYRRDILDVLDGLFILKEHHYEYAMNGLDADIVLLDPWCRKHPRQTTGKVTPIIMLTKLFHLKRS